jgi:hypothetical protein
MHNQLESWVTNSNGSLEYEYITSQWAGIAQSVWPLATGWTGQRSNPDEKEIFPHLSRPGLVPT